MRLRWKEVGLATWPNHTLAQLAEAGGDARPVIKDSVRQDAGEKGKSVGTEDQIRRKRTPSFSSHESSVPRDAQNQRRWKIIDTLLCRRGND